MDIFDISSLYGALLGAVGIYRYQRLDSTRQIFVVYQAINMLTTIAQIILAKQFINSHWTLHVTSAIRYSFFAYILSCGITSLRTRMYFRYSIPAFLVVWLCLELTVENIQSFSIYTRPMEGILLIIGSMVTIHSLNSSSV
ncbi:MAG: hypothetical protein HYZ34_06975, partial [Ignavibacteriae bacterium]|nr:hypothetical protein [Ignavibacteriota bacterium]